MFPKLHVADQFRKKRKVELHSELCREPWIFKMFLMQFQLYPYYYIQQGVKLTGQRRYILKK